MKLVAGRTMVLPQEPNGKMCQSAGPVPSVVRARMILKWLKFDHRYVLAKA